MIDKGPERCLIYSTYEIDKRIDLTITFEYAHDIKLMCNNIKNCLILKYNNNYYYYYYYYVDKIYR